MNTYNTPQWRERENNGGTWVNWTANNSKISRVCNNPYTNAITTNAHVSVAVYVSRQPTCLVYVFRVAVRETYKSCGCFVFLYVFGCKGTYFPSHSDTFCYLSYGLISISGFKGLDFILRFLAMAEPEPSELCSPEHLLRKQEAKKLHSAHLA